MSAQWFESLGKCAGCGKAATGKLRSHVNDSIGSYCERCANREIKQAHKRGKFMPASVLPLPDSKEGGQR